MGEVNKINLKSIPTVMTLIKEIVNKEIEDLCYPALVKMDIPCVLEPKRLDAKGKVIKKKGLKSKGKLRARSKSVAPTDRDEIEHARLPKKKSDGHK